MPKRKTQESDGMRMLNFRIESGLIDRLREVAASEHRTVSQELRHLVDRRLAEAATEREAEAA